MTSPDWSLLVHHPTQERSVDATTAGVSAEALDALPWDRVFSQMEALEGGAEANPDEGRQVGHYWLRDPDRAPPELGAGIRRELEAVLGFAEAVRSGRVAAGEHGAFTDVLHIGIGGSALGPFLLVDALAEGTGLSVHFLDNTNPDGIARVLRHVGERLATTLVVVVSKSGGTPETVNAMELVGERLAVHGLSLAERAVAITMAGSRLDRRAQSDGWLKRFELWDWVGGRTSVTSSVGLLPAALAGLDVEALLAGAREMDTWTRAPAWRDNPAALLAGVWHVVGRGRGDRAMVMLPYADRLVSLSRYLQQLVMESLGKRLDLDGNEVFQGLTVYGNKGSTDQHAFVQQLRDGRDDFFVTFVQVLGDGLGSARPVDDQGATAGDYLQGFLLGTRQALAEERKPSLVITLPRVDALELGAVVALFERAVGLYASLVGINAYHQPGVEAGKRAARGVLDVASRLREALSDAPRTADELSRTVDADAVLTLHLLDRLHATGRAKRDGSGPGARYSR